MSASAPPADRPLTENSAASGRHAVRAARELVAYREVALQLALRDIKVRYKQTLVGVVWVVLQPVLSTVVFTLVFGRLAGLESEGLPYAVFVLAGLLGWTYVSASVGAAAESLTDNRDLVTKTYFPRLLGPLAAVLPPLLDIGPGLLVLAVVMAVNGISPDAALVTLPLWFVAAMLVALGAGLWLAALNALYRDVRYTLQYVLQIWLFASPVVFTLSSVHGLERALVALNPMVGVLDGLRWSLCGAPAPPATDLVSLLSGLALLAGGFIYFGRAEWRIADRI